MVRLLQFEVLQSYADPSGTLQRLPKVVNWQRGGGPKLASQHSVKVSQRIGDDMLQLVIVSSFGLRRACWTTSHSINEALM